MTSVNITTKRNTVTVNGDVKTLPFDVSYGDSLEITITKLDVANPAFLTIIGNAK